MNINKIEAGSIFPAITVQDLDGNHDDIGNIKGGLLKRHLPDRDLGQSAIPMHVVATDILTGTEVVLSSGPVIKAVLASAAVPALFPPVKLEGRYLADGGIANNTPISAAVPGNPGLPPSDPVRSWPQPRRPS